VTPLQRQIISAVGRIRSAGSVYLAGGTALALFYLGHRRSFDVDLFVREAEAVRAVGQEAVAAWTAAGFEVVPSLDKETFVEWTVRSAEGPGVRVQVALDTAVLLDPLREFPEFPGLRVAGLRDLAASKAEALADRGALRDFIDVYFLVRSGLRLSDILRWAAERTPGFSPLSVAQSIRRLPGRLAEQEERQYLDLLLQPFDEDHFRATLAGWADRIAAAYARAGWLRPHTADPMKRPVYEGDLLGRPADVILDILDRLEGDDGGRP